MYNMVTQNFQFLTQVLAKMGIKGCVMFVYVPVSTIMCTLWNLVRLSEA